MKTDVAVREAMEAVRSIMSRTAGTEEEVLRVFSEEFGSEVAGWDMRLEELEGEAT